MKMLNQQTYFPTKATQDQSCKRKQNRAFCKTWDLSEKKTRKDKADEQGRITLLSYGARMDRQLLMKQS